MSLLNQQPQQQSYDHLSVYNAKSPTIPAAPASPAPTMPVGSDAPPVEDVSTVAALDGLLPAPALEEPPLFCVVGRPL